MKLIHLCSEVYTTFGGGLKLYHLFVDRTYKFWYIKELSNGKYIKAKPNRDLEFIGEL